MKLKDFKKILDCFSDDLEVYQSRDGEGNGYLKFYDVSIGFYDEREEEFWEPEQFEDAPSTAKVNCIVLFPEG
jgi:hypothetical protein